MRQPGGQDQLTLISTCSGCRRPLYGEKVWTKMSIKEREASGGVAALADGMCARCIRSPHLRDPEPGEPYEDPVCTGCGKELISPAQWRRANQAERDELIDEGYVRERREGQCYGCIRVVRPVEDWELRRRKPGETIKLYIECRNEGMTERRQIAEKIGISTAGLSKAIRKAQMAGQELP